MADQGGEGLLSPFLRNRRIAAARPYLTGRVLDVGCGSGALAGLVPADRYFGVDVDAASLALARGRHPDHRFEAAMPQAEAPFDVVVSLAVIEHVPDPAAFLAEMAARLKPGAGGKVVVTTPHPAVDWVHTLGSSIGLFSQHASEEHEELLDEGKLRQAGEAAGLRMVSYRRFLLWANQIAVFEKVAA